MSEHDAGEFAWLADQASELNIDGPLPGVQRVAHEAPDGLIVSGIRFGDTAPRFVFLHGAGLNAHTFDTTVLALGEPALSLDLPGHGDSAWRADATYSPASIGSAVADAIASEVSEPIVLIGHSLGGMTASWIAAHRPELVASLVLVDIVPGIDPSVGPQVLRAFYSQLEFPSRTAVADYAESFGMGGSRAALERGVFFNTRVREDGVVEWKHHFARLAAQILPAADGSGDQLLRGAGWEDLAMVTAPIMLVRALDGFVSADDLALFRERVPQANIHEVPGSHNVQEHDPAHLASLIRSATPVAS